MTTAGDKHRSVHVLPRRASFCHLLSVVFAVGVNAVMGASFVDTFERPNSDTVGNDWSTYGNRADFSIYSGALRVSKHYAANVDGQVHAVGRDFKHVRLRFRTSSTESGSQVQCYFNTGSYSFDLNVQTRFQVMKVNNVTVPSATPTANRWYLVEFFLQDNTVDVCVDGSAPLATIAMTPVVADPYVQLGVGGVNHFFTTDYDFIEVRSACAHCGLLAHYPLDGNAQDVSGNGNDGIVHGALGATDHAGNPLSALSFGAGTYVQTPFVPQFAQNDHFSISVWIRSRNSSSEPLRVLGLERGDNQELHIAVRPDSQGGRATFRVRDDAGHSCDAESPASVNDNEWHHLVAVRTDHLSLYLDNVLVNRIPDTTTTSLNYAVPQWLAIGANHHETRGVENFFRGEIDDVRIYSRALSSSEISQLYSGSYQTERIQTLQPDEDNHLNSSSSTGGDGLPACSGMSPVFAQSGDYRTRMDDAVLPCRGLPLQITRFYNSIENYDGPFSYGWCFNQTVQLMQMVSSNGQETAIVRWANGVRKDFTLTNGVYQAPLGCYDNLTTNAGGFVLKMPSGMKMSFNPGGFLTNQTDRYGNAVTYEHDLRNRISQVQSADGRTLNYFYDETINRVTNITDWSSRSWGYSYSTNDDLVRVTYPDGATITYEFDDAHHLTGVYDARSNRIGSLTYAENSGRAMSYSEGSEVDYSFEYNAHSNYTTKTDSMGREHGFAYNEYGNKVSKVDPAGNEMLFSWTADQQINSRTDPRGYPQYFEYDERGNVVLVSNALGYVTRYTYETNYNQVTSITDPLGNVASNRYDTWGSLIWSRDARGFVTEYQYDSYGQLTNAIDANGNSSSMAYNEHGELLALTDPLGRRVIYAYDSRGNRLTMTDARSNTWSYGYDIMGRLLASTNPLGQVTSCEYDANGNRIAVTDARTNTTRFAYDEYNRLVAVTNALGVQAGRMVYDIYGNVIATYDALGNVVSNTYDILNRLVTARDPLGNPISFAYDENGNRTVAMDALTNTTRYAFDPLNRMTAMTNALGGVWRYHYDANHNLLAVSDANSHTSTNAYDARNMVTNSANPLGHAYQYEYDGNGNIVERRDPNGATLYYSYDAANRLTNIAYPDGAALTFTHDENGNVRSMSNRSETVRYAYDALNRVTNVLVVGLNKTIVYEYDAVGNRAAMIDPDGARMEYEYDALNRLVELRDPETNTWSFSYDAVSRMTNMVMANGVRATYQYDRASRLTNLVYRKSNTNILQSFAYTYDAVGNPLRVKREDNLYELYEYDKTYQLTRVDYDSANTAGPGPKWTMYKYDPVGNRTNLVNESITETYIYDAANRLLSVSSALSAVSLQWDDNGNLTNKLVDGAQAEAYGWDYDNKMIEIRYADGMTNTFAYYPGGLRLSKTLEGSIGINGRFESPAVSKTNSTEVPPSGWGWFSSTWQNAGITRQVKLSGEQALYFSSRGSNSAYQGCYMHLPVVTGKTYRFEVHALNRADNSLSGDAYGQLSIEWKNELGEEVLRTWGPTWGPSLSTSTWTSVAVTGQAPSEAVTARFVINSFDGNPAGGGTFFVDDAIIEIVGEAPERTEQYFYDGQNLLQEYDGLGTLMAQYVYSLGIDSLLARTAGGSQKYYLRDMIGSVTAITDTDENMVANFRYDAFGSVRRGWGGEDNPYLFTSRRLDQDSGLYYYRARYLGAQRGLFVSVDPIIGGTRYDYVRNRPAAKADPLGLLGAPSSFWRWFPQSPAMPSPMLPFPDGSEMQTPNVLLGEVSSTQSAVDTLSAQVNALAGFIGDVIQGVMCTFARVAENERRGRAIRRRTDELYVAWKGALADDERRALEVALALNPSLYMDISMPFRAQAMTEHGIPTSTEDLRQAAKEYAERKLAIDTFHKTMDALGTFQNKGDITYFEYQSWGKTYSFPMPNGAALPGGDAGQGTYLK